ncbi:MAG: hypothetical protein IPN68_18315 [Bacteroidetes bacterium]|nr:hypothetical protein [Bacteroidota bacterium]
MIADRLETREADALKTASQITYNLTDGITLYYDPGIDKPLIPKIKEKEPAKDSPVVARDEFQK